MSETPKKRVEQLIRFIPDALLYQTVLYIGVNEHRMQMVSLFRAAGLVVDAFEIWPKNFKTLLVWNKKHKVFRKIIKGDVRKIDLPRKYDVVMWWHGPEHIGKKELLPVLERLESIAYRLVILSSPWGVYRQGAVDGNPNEKHLSSIYPETLEAIGYETDVIGVVDTLGSNLLAWKRIA